MGVRGGGTEGSSGAQHRWTGPGGLRPRRVQGSALAFLKSHPAWRCFLWGLISALALPPVYLLPVLLFSIPGLLKAIEQAKSRKHVGLIGWAWGFGFGLGGLYWITEPILTEAAAFWWLAPFAAPLLAAAVAFYTVIPVLAASFVRPGLGRLLVFAGAWVLADLLQQFAFTGFPWNYLGTCWTIPGPIGDIFIQPAAIFGVHGLTLLTVLLAGTPLFRGRGLAVLAVSLVIWAGFGDWRLSIQPKPTDITLALVQPDFPVPGNYDRPTLEAHWQRLLEMSRAGIAAGADTVIWPEAASPWALASDPVARQQLSQATGDTPILAGAFHVLPDGTAYNAMVVTDGPGPAVAIYDKWKLVPFGEYMPKWIPVKIIPDELGTGFAAGTGPKTLHVPGLPPFGPLICYEDVFTGQIVVEKDRPDWLVVITDDAWFGNSAGPRQHFEAARLRAVEEGLPLARDANSGISAVINANGQVVARLPLNSQGVLLSRLPGKLPATVFARLGLTTDVVLGFAALITGVLISMVV